MKEMTVDPLPVFDSVECPIEMRRISANDLRRRRRRVSGNKIKKIVGRKGVRNKVTCCSLDLTTKKRPIYFQREKDIFCLRSNSEVGC